MNESHMKHLARDIGEQLSTDKWLVPTVTLRFCVLYVLLFICDKYYHFFAITFGLGCGMALYRPYHTLIVPAVLAIIFTIIFEIVGLSFGLPAHTAKCKGPPYDKRDYYWGFFIAVFVAVLNSNRYHVYTLSYGCGMMAFALRGAKRKYSSLWELRERQYRW